MPDVMAVLGRWWKPMTSIIVVATVAALVLTLLLPKRFYAVATALPASSFAADKAAIFNTNIQQLYPSLGTPDDLDRILGTAQLDTLYIATVHDLNLTAHYNFESGPDGTERALRRLKKNTSVTKSEWGELRLKVADADRFQAALIANTLLQKLQQLHQALQSKSNSLVLEQLKILQGQLPSGDTTQKPITTRNEQAQVYEKLAMEYNLMVATNPPVLLVVENARPPLYPDTTATWATVLFTAFAAALFSVLLALYLDGKKART